MTKMRFPIAIYNRSSGNILFSIDDTETYVKIYAKMCDFPDVKMAIKVWCDITGKKKRELLRDFSLVELTNTFSTSYFARVIKKGVK